MWCASFTLTYISFVLTYLNNLHGEVVRTGGYIVGETGNRYLTTTNGTLQAGLTTITTTGINTSGADVFEYYHKIF